MRLRRVLNGMCKYPAGLLLVAGAIGVAAAASYLLRPPITSKVKAFPQAEPDAREKRAHYFRIRHTQSELGYAYWVLQGYGQFRRYELYDTWREACDEAVRRAQAAAAQPPLVLATAG